MLTLGAVINMSTEHVNLFSTLSADFSFESFIDNFHFIRPSWLMAFFALFLVLWLLKKIRYYQSPWQHFLPKHLSNALLESSNKATSEQAVAKNRYWLKPSIIGSCIIIALAGPAWQKLPQPVYQLERGAVLVMDMSYSMYSTDIKPNRLTRARYKAIDLLNNIKEGDIGLIAYAGDAFIISPLTQDVKNIELLLPSLSPDIMPVHGANALAALTLADQTLKNAGHVSGDIYWFTDDIDNEEMSDIYDWSNKNSHSLNILGVGTQAGAPIKLSSGKLLKDNRGAIVVPKLPEHRLSAISKRSSGSYHSITNNDSDIKKLTAHLSQNLDDKLETDSSNTNNGREKEQSLQGDKYQEAGPWLLIIILPFLLSYFRRGSSILAISWLLPVTLTISLMGTSTSSFANEQRVTDTTSSTSNDIKTSENTATTLWKNLWKTPDQQAQQHFQQEQYQQAAKQFENSQWQGSAHYKAGDYEQALEAFKQSDTAQSLYNQGNAHAQLQQVDEAIAAYKDALKKDPNLSGAKENLAQLEALKKQQEQSKQNSQDGDPQDSENDEQQQSDDQKQDSEQSDSEQQQDKQQDGQTSKDPQQQNQEQQRKDQEKEQEQEQEQEQQNQSQKEQSQQEAEQEEQQAKRAQEQKTEEEKLQEEKALAQQASDSKKQETEQKHQQLLNKVTDDPYLLLRNKMRLEYQKRRNEGASQGGNKKW